MMAAAVKPLENPSTMPAELVRLPAVVATADRTATPSAAIAANMISPARIADTAPTPSDVRIEVKLNCHSYTLASACAGTTSRT